MSIHLSEGGAASAHEIPLLGLFGAADMSTVSLIYVSQQTGGIEQARKRVRRQWKDGLVPRFAERVRALEPQAQVWAAAEDDLMITTVTQRDDLDHELTLHAIFVDVAREYPTAATGALVVRTVGETRDDVDLGERVA